VRSGLRVARRLWPLLFFFPLGLVADRGCAVAGVDPLYHALVFVHAWMPQLLGGVGLLSAALAYHDHRQVVAHFARLQSVASSVPPSLVTLLAEESAAIGVPDPRLVYVDAPQRFCMVAPTKRDIFVSRGFVADLDADDARLLLRHELAHIDRRDARTALRWRLATRALLLPGLDRFRRDLHLRRELAADAVGGRLDRRRYRELLTRVSARSMPAEKRTPPMLAVRLRERDVEDRSVSLFRPLVIAALVAGGLVVSHIVFTMNEPYLLTHHC